MASLPAPPAGAAASDKITIEIASTAKADNGKLLFVTTGGKVWKQTDGDPVRHPKPGAQVEISKASFGGYWCQLDRWTTVRCERIDQRTSNTRQVTASEAPPATPLASERPANPTPARTGTGSAAIREKTSGGASTPSGLATPPTVSITPSAAAARISEAPAPPPPPPGPVAVAAPLPQSPPSPIKPAPTAASPPSAVIASTTATASPAAPAAGTSINSTSGGPDHPPAQEPDDFGLPAHKHSTAAEPEDFGLPNASDEPKRAEVTVAATGKTSNGKLLFTTSEGAVWFQTDGDPVRAPRAGTKVTITKSPLGGHWCDLDRWTSVKCQQSK